MAKKEVSKKEEQAPAQRPSTSVESPFTELRRQMDRLFDDFAEGWGWPSLSRWSLPSRSFDIARPTMGGVMSVDFDVSEDDQKIQIKGDLPGMDKDDVDISVENGVLTIKGEKREEKEEKEKDYYLSERQYGSFRRSFRLPESVDEDKIAANFKKGVLDITLPKKAEAKRKAKKISVKGG